MNVDVQGEFAAEDILAQEPGRIALVDGRLEPLIGQSGYS